MINRRPVQSARHSNTLREMSSVHMSRFLTLRKLGRFPVILVESGRFYLAGPSKAEPHNDRTAIHVDVLERMIDDSWCVEKQA